jgi:hypothetical protein
MKKLAIGVASAFVGYVLLLVVLGFVVQGCVHDRVRSRLAESLDAEVTIESTSVSLLRGKVELRGIHVVRERGGHLELSIERLEADMAAWGWMTFDRDPRAVRVSGATLSISGAGALASRNLDHEPMHVGSIDLRDARIVLMPTAVLPNVGRVELDIEQAHTGACTLSTGISWVFALERLQAVARLPGDVSVAVGYGDEHLSIGAGLFGSEPVRVRFAIPKPEPGKLELAQLADLGKALGKSVLKQGARDWFRTKVTDPIRGAID